MAALNYCNILCSLFIIIICVQYGTANQQHAHGGNVELKSLRRLEITPYVLGDGSRYRDMLTIEASRAVAHYSQKNGFSRNVSIPLRQDNRNKSSCSRKAAFSRKNASCVFLAVKDGQNAIFIDCNILYMVQSSMSLCNVNSIFVCKNPLNKFYSHKYLQPNFGRTWQDLAGLGRTRRD
jgi:hypothetical protein